MRPASHPIIHGLAGMAGHRHDGRRPSPLSAARLSRPLRMWPENNTWSSNEEGVKGRIQVGQFAHLIVPDRDFFSCAEGENTDTKKALTLVGGRIVYRQRPRVARRIHAAAGHRRLVTPAQLWRLRRLGRSRPQDAAPDLERPAAAPMRAGRTATITRGMAGRLPIADLRSFMLGGVTGTSDYRGLMKGNGAGVEVRGTPQQ
jgi:hypothetical protein